MTPGDYKELPRKRHAAQIVRPEIQREGSMPLRRDATGRAYRNLAEDKNKARRDELRGRKPSPLELKRTFWIDNGRYLFVAVLVLLIFGTISFRLWTLQIRDHRYYLAEAESKMQRTVALYGARGTIMDRNAQPLAYDKRCYDVAFYRDPDRRTQEDRAEYTQLLYDVIKIVERNGRRTVDSFWLRRGNDGEWAFQFGDVKPETAAARERMWRTNFSIGSSVSVDSLFELLCRNYGLPAEWTEEEKIKVLSLWQESRMNAYLPKATPIAYNVDLLTVSELEASAHIFPGISVQPSFTRVYPRGSLAAHIIGYTSRIDSPERMAELGAIGYPVNARLGVSGVESSLENDLTPNLVSRAGSRIVETNTMGKVVREIAVELPVDGNHVMLTMDSWLQGVAEKALEDVIKQINQTQVREMRRDSWKARYGKLAREYQRKGIEIKTAQTGAIVIMDIHTGKILAMASYPDYDLTMFQDGLSMADWMSIRDDPRNPMFNRAVSTRDTPGSIFKMVTALGGLMEGIMTPSNIVYDPGTPFEGYDTVHPPSCWKKGGHGDMDLVEALTNSCNFYFFTMGAQLRVDNINKWAARLGLTSRTGIELGGEVPSFVGSQMMLYDPDRAITDQYTYKPEFSAMKIKQKLVQIGQDRRITYDEERLDRVTRQLLNVVVEEDRKDDWARAIHQILMNELNLPIEYIQRNYLANQFQSYLNDLQWTANETIMCAIGQSITQVTPVGLARYVSAIANGGLVFDAQLVDKVISPDGLLVLDKQPTKASSIEDPYGYFELLRRGMEHVTSAEDGGTAASYYKDSKYPIAAKTGTAQRTRMDIENNAWQVAFAPYDDPQIAVVVYVQNGFAGAQTSPAVIDVVTAYLDNLTARESVGTTLQTGNALAR